MKVYAIQVEHGSYSDYRCEFLAHCHASKEAADARVADLHRAQSDLAETRSDMMEVESRFPWRDDPSRARMAADPEHAQLLELRRLAVAGLLDADSLWPMIDTYMTTGYDFSVVELEMVD